MSSFWSIRRSQLEAIIKECSHAQLKPETHDFRDKNSILPRSLFGDHTADNEPEGPWARDCASTSSLQV